MAPTVQYLRRRTNERRSRRGYQHQGEGERALPSRGSRRGPRREGRDGLPRRSTALCRCGRSSNKPFCDGTHKTVGFDGTETADAGPIADRRDAYEAAEVTIYDDRSVCAHAGACTDGLPAVWKLGTEPWIDQNAASADEIKATIAKCPSGALTSSEPGGAVVEQPLSPAVKAGVNGPYQVRGGIPVTSSGGETYEVRNRQTLCRCCLLYTSPSPRD